MKGLGRTVLWAMAHRSRCVTQAATERADIALIHTEQSVEQLKVRGGGGGCTFCLVGLLLLGFERMGWGRNKSGWEAGRVGPVVAGRVGSVGSDRTGMLGVGRMGGEAGFQSAFVQTQQMWSS